MPDYTAMFAADVERVKGDLPATVMWSGQQVDGTGSATIKTKTDALEGMYPDYDYTWVGKSALFVNSVTPDTGDDLTIGGVQYFVKQKISDLGVVTLRLALQ